MLEHIWTNTDSSRDYLPKPLLIVDDFGMKTIKQDWSSFDYEILNHQKEQHPFYVLEVWDECTVLDPVADKESYDYAVKWMSRHYSWTGNEIQIKKLSL